MRKVDFLKTCIPFVCFFVVFYILLLPANLRTGSDDTAHFADIDRLGVLDWVRYRVQVWQPRYISDALYAFFIYRLPLWKVVNAAVMTILLGVVFRIAQGFNVSRLSNNHQSDEEGTPISRSAKPYIISAVFVCLAFFLIHPNVITSSSVWYTGSFYYLWPIAGMLIGLLPFFAILYGKDLYREKKWLIPICILLSLISGYTEQTTAVHIGISLLILLYVLMRHKRRPSVWLFIHFAATLVNSALFLYANFNSPRVLGGEENALFPESLTYSAADKLLLGLNVMDTHLMRGSNLLFLALLVLVGTLVFRKLSGRKGFFRVLRFAAFLPAAYVIIGMLASLPGAPGVWNYTKLTMEQTGKGGVFGQSWTSPFDFLWQVPPLNANPAPSYIVTAVFAAVCVFAVFPLLFWALCDKTDRFLAIILYLAALCSGVIMGFSVTVWASESRPYFMANILLLLIIAIMIRTLLKTETKTSGGALKYIAIAALFAFACVAVYLYHAVFITDTYWWY